MTARELGTALGYPACCVEEFAADVEAGRQPYRLRGAVQGGVRTEDALPSGGCGRAGARILYVPCSQCAVSGA